MKLYILLVMLIPSLVFGAGITVISQDQNQVVLEFNLPEFNITHEAINGATWQKISSDEGTVYAQEGYPELRMFNEAVAIPIDGDISIQVTNVTSSTLRNINLVPVLKMVAEKEEIDYVFYQNPGAYRSSQMYPGNLTIKNEPAFVGDRHFIPISIFPFQYKAMNKELVVNSKFTITIQINGSKSASPGWQQSVNYIDQVGDSFFVNNASSKAWRLPKQRATDYEAPKNGSSDVAEIQLIVNQEGIYKVSYQLLSDFIQTMTDSLGVNLAWDIDNIDPRNLELRDENGTVPLNFEGEVDSSFDPGDFFEFYGDRHYGDDGYSDDFTDENVYTLYLKNGLGARMAVENGGLVVANPAQYIVPDSYEFTAHFEQQIISDKLGNKWSNNNPGYYEEDIWFWRKINAPNLDIIPFELQYPKDSIIRTGSVVVSLYGLTYAEELAPNAFDHEATVRINEAMINTHSWRGQNEKIFLNQNPVANSFFRHGTNNLYISLSGNTASGTREQVLFDYMDLKYWREYKTSEDKIRFTKPSNRPSGLYQFQVDGFSENNISMYKIGSSVFNNCQIEPFNLDGNAPWTITIQDSVASNSILYYAVAENQKMAPLELRFNLPSDLKNPANAADVILVSNKEFLASEGTDMLVSLWETDGYTVAKVDYQDIFDEFNSGIRSAESLKEFFTYVYNNWGSPQLSHVVLLGEGVDDERDDSPSRKYTLVPVKKTWTNVLGATASDGWYASIVGTDPVPDFAISRINAWNENHILDYANKAYNYRNNPATERLWNSHVTLTSGGKVTDSPEESVFASQSERIRRKCIPQEYRATRVYTSTQNVSSDYFGGTFDLKDAFNSGTQYLHFLGHGGGRIWADYNLFNFNDVATLNNQVYPIVLSLACYASSFDTNGIASISEALVMQPGRGAIVALGFSGLGYMYQDEAWGLALTEALFKHDFPTLGDAYRYALARFYVTTDLQAARYALTLASALLGDPLIKPLKPIGDIPVSIENYVLSPGDTLRVNAVFPSDVTGARMIISDSNEIEINIPIDMPVINGQFNASYIIPENIEPPYSRHVYVGGYSPTKEYVGRSLFGVGRPAILHISTNPPSPAWLDSVGFSCKAFSAEPIISLNCKVAVDSLGTSVNWVTLPMTTNGQETGLYSSSQKIPGQDTGEEIYFKYILTTESGTYESNTINYVTRGPDLMLSSIMLENTTETPSIKVLVRNIGDAPSILTDLQLYIRPTGGNQTLFSTQNLMPLQINEERWETIPLNGLAAGNITFEARVNWSESHFPEWNYSQATNNTISLLSDFNFHQIDSEGGEFYSLDNNLKCEIPEGLVPEAETTSFYINNAGVLNASDQPDIQEIKLSAFDQTSSFPSSNAYEISCLNPALADSTSLLINNKKLKLSFFYSETDAETQSLESENSYKIYRWDSGGNKWILQGGNVSAAEDKVVFEVRKLGIYTIYRNNDRVRPSIDINVQDQEFTVGGYISGTGTISLLLSDSNGIDVFDNTIKLYLNGVPIEESSFVASVNLGNVNRIPIKYQLNLNRGNYTLVVDCKDVNGNFNTREMQFVVNELFDVRNVANYPNPVLGRAEDPKNDGRTRFTYVLTDDADDVTIKVYSVSGRLVKTFENLPTGVGYHEYPRTIYGWDCKDDFGFALANGVYFYKIIASKGSKKIEKTIKMAILK